MFRLEIFIDMDITRGYKRALYFGGAVVLFSGALYFQPTFYIFTANKLLPHLQNIHPYPASSEKMLNWMLFLFPPTVVFLANCIWFWSLEIQKDKSDVRFLWMVSIALAATLFSFAAGWLIHLNTHGS